MSCCPADFTSIQGVCGCLGRTCLKWRPDGELTALDFSLVMQRLSQVDPEVMALRTITGEPEPSPSLS